MKLTKGQLQLIIDQHENMKNSYFYHSPKNASSRRSYEKNNTLHFIGEFAGHELDLLCKTSCSCKNVYYTGTFIVDGKKTTIRKIKNLIK